MSYFSAMDVSASGLSVQRARMDLISQNIANVNTTRTEDGTPYRRQTLSVSAAKNSYANSKMLSKKATELESKKATLKEYEEYIKNIEGKVNK